MKAKNRILKITAIFLTVITILNFSCKEDEPQPLVATSIETVSGDSQTAQIETSLANPVVVIVKNQNGNAFKGAIVKFAVTEGSLSATSVTTDASGKANVNWTLGATVGTQTLTVNAFKADGETALSGSPISITATATAEPLVATSIELVSGNSQTAQLLSALANPVIVLVKDQNGDAFAGVEVSFTVTEGSVSNATVTTDANGSASVTWTLGETIGTQTLNASVTGLTGSPVEFSATGTQITVTDYDDNTYYAVIIGTQVWMAENLRVTSYPNGDPIPNVTSSTAWNNLGDNNTDDAYIWYDNDDINNKGVYGGLYTYAAAIADNWTRDNTANQGVCPDGWHLPTDAEWTTLTDYLGGESVAGGKLKETGTTHWNSPNTGADNSSGFTALPSAYRTTDGFFNNIGNFAYIWSATENDATNTWRRNMNNTASSVDRGAQNKSFGFSVRCLRN